MKIRFLSSQDDLTCKICDSKITNLNHLGMHIKKYHDISSTEYSKQYIFEGNLPKCKCGCGSDVTIYKFEYQDYHVGHNPNCHWQKKFPKDSVEFKTRVESIKKKLHEYYQENPKQVSDETRELLRNNRLKFIEENPEVFAEWMMKMTETKQARSKEGLYSGENNYFHKLTDEEKKIRYEKYIETLNNKSDEEKQLLSKKRSDINKEYWKSLTPEDREIHVKNIGIAINNMDPETKRIKFENHSKFMKQRMQEVENDQALRPMYNKETIPYIKNVLSSEYDTEFIHAESGHGEFRIYDRELDKLYFADAYSKELNLWIEFDEPNKFVQGVLKENHLDRENRIKNCLPGVEIVRIYFDKKTFNPNQISVEDSPLGGRLIVR